MGSSHGQPIADSRKPSRLILYFAYVAEEARTHRRLLSISSLCVKEHHLLIRYGTAPHLPTVGAVAITVSAPLSWAMMRALESREGVEYEERGHEGRKGPSSPSDSGSAKHPFPLITPLSVSHSQDGRIINRIVDPLLRFVSTGTKEDSGYHDVTCGVAWTVCFVDRVSHYSHRGPKGIMSSFIRSKDV